MAHAQVIASACRSEGLAEILERVLDKGVVIAGDIRIKLCDIELLSIQIRLLVCSVDKAREMGLTWWWQQPQPQLQPPLQPQPQPQPQLQPQLQPQVQPQSSPHFMAEPPQAPWGHAVQYREKKPVR